MKPIKHDVANRSVTTEGNVVWNAERTSDEQLPQRLQVSAPRQPLRENTLHDDRLLEFRVVQVLSAVRKSEVLKLIFVTVPGGDRGNP